MRLICPNCGAQYEVPVDAIPAGGRDVQCSSCGHTWFQLHPEDTLRVDDPAAPQPDDLSTDDIWEEMDEGTSLPSAEPDAAPAPDPDPAPAAAEAPSQESATPVPRRPVRARGLDPSVAEVLRQEAEREARRRTDPEPLESQPDLGLTEPSGDDAAHRARVAREHMARIRGDAPLSEEPRPEQKPVAEPETPDSPEFVTSEPEHPAVAPSRRDLLPDIEEINQTLRVAPEPRRMETPQGRALYAEEEEQQSSGFARGFGAMLILAVLSVLLYALAPALTDMVPALAPLLDPYVATVDGMRLWLDAQLGALLG
ncbi:zinc-ribbon domain-containing protein [Alloyangia pacifica]|uniref:MJ0042 family finger-like domain-containing protein n=1 Tax=Alloyangia pacifica TaxID=311180 RepID=A0A1I6TQA5_9RHOB|nr:zinc-ribbon domain-containing protein [Alloyangia pacifica]SDH10702.1 MJ0042 family finger-like domain-containing protein [Alloyangia pacifica]SFS91308.1 MJ0042 family finger-like domain-containing protein [Alloyangia pacifica]